MGLDGISLNQLGIPHDTSTTKINKTQNTENQFRIDGLNKGQIVESEKEKQEKSNDKQSAKNQNTDESETEQEELTLEAQDIERYDLSDNTKYCLKIDENTNAIIIYDKITNKPLQRINPDKLSEFISNLSDSKGFIVNRKL